VGNQAVGKQEEYLRCILPLGVDDPVLTQQILQLLEVVLQATRGLATRVLEDGQSIAPFRVIPLGQASEVLLLLILVPLTEVSKGPQIMALDPHLLPQRRPEVGLTEQHCSGLNCIDLHGEWVSTQFSISICWRVPFKLLQLH